VCGIAGCVDLEHGLGPARGLVGEMTDTLRHRGPDDAGMLEDGPVTLGHRRLSIIDLSPAGHQPMPNHEGTAWLTFNGEIYNYIELRNELGELGRECVTASDTEVLLAAYDEWGVGMLNRLNGMFAFAIWDSASSTLLLARDRFGVKPLYYTSAAGRFRFGSEIKGLLIDDAVPRAPNDARVLEFLAYGIADHTEETMFEGVYQVPPGSYLQLRPYEAPSLPQRWYTLEPARGSRGAAGTRIRALLDRAIALRLRSDVPVGVALSGGMDSSSILAVAAALRRDAGVDAPKSFTSRSSDSAIDEYSYARRVVSTAGSENETVLPTFKGLMDELDSLVWHMDEPFHSPSVYGQRKVDELARKAGVIVLLDGQGGDEVLSGYHHFHYPPLLLALLRRGKLATFVREARARRQRIGTSLIRSAKDVVRLGAAPYRRGVGRPDWLAAGVEVAERPAPHASLASHQDYGLSIFPLPAYNHHADRNSMTFSLETRNPFLDVHLVEAARALESEDLLHDGFTKWALREAVRDVVPYEVVERAEKQGFTTDEAIWLRDGALADDFEQTFLSASFAGRGYFDPAKVLGALAEHRSGGNRSAELWRAYVTERWLRLFVDPATLRAPAPPDSAVESHVAAIDRLARVGETAPRIAASA
jgi:asparagine synthase (glutamine-hydrolysing)